MDKAASDNKATLHNPNNPKSEEKVHNVQILGMGQDLFLEFA